MKAEIKPIVNRDKMSKHRVGDKLMQRGCDKALIRRHNQWRDEMFTPLNVAYGPNHIPDSGSCQTSIGSFKHGGGFTKVEDWKDASEPNRKLVSSWNGRTVFSARPLSSEAIDSPRLTIGAGISGTRLN